MGPDPVSHAPIGVFDSGVGGLSILQALQAELPHEDFLYVADSGHAPYGERDPQHVIDRSRAITQHLVAHCGVKMLVVACNTATAAAIHVLRAEYPGLPMVGVEPALKPAVALSTTGRIGVVATRSTLGSSKFHTLVAAQDPAARFVLQPCDGLAYAIETADATKTEALCAEYTLAMGRFGTQNDDIDTLVLGCTHYRFAADLLQRQVGPAVRLIDTGPPVAQQARRLLAADGLLRKGPGGATQFFTTGRIEALRSAANRWVCANPEVAAWPPAPPVAGRMPQR